MHYVWKSNIKSTKIYRIMSTNQKSYYSHSIVKNMVVINICLGILCDLHENSFWVKNKSFTSKLIAMSKMFFVTKCFLFCRPGQQIPPNDIKTYNRTYVFSLWWKSHDFEFSLKSQFQLWKFIKHENQKINKILLFRPVLEISVTPDVSHWYFRWLSLKADFH